MRPKGQKQKKSTSLLKPRPNPFRTNRFDDPETWRAVLRKQNSASDRGSGNAKSGIEDKSSLVLIQVFCGRLTVQTPTELEVKNKSRSC
jgi:hypothetical protein